jgi:cobalt-zinc-cadmium efflux system outer membrane protein
MHRRPGATRRIVQFSIVLGCLAAPLALTTSYARADVVPPPTEIPQRLTLDDALALFRARGFDLLIADAAVMSAEGDEKTAGAVPNPIGNVGYGRVLSDAAGAAPNQFLFGLSDNAAIVDSLAGKRGLRLDVAHAALAAAKMQRVDAQRTLEFQIKQAYIQVALALQALSFAKDVAAANQQTVELNSRKYKAGAINEGDLARVETAKLEADQAVDTATLNVRTARLQLAYLLGSRGRVPDFDVETDILKYRVPGSLASANPDGLVKSAFDTRPDLKALGYQRARAQAQIDLAKRQRFPDIALSAQYTPTSAAQPQTLSFGVTVPLPLFYQQQGEIRRAEADYDTQSLQQAKLTAQVVSDVETAFASFSASRRLVERMETTLLDRARTARDITQRQFQGGTANLIDFLDAQRTFIATNLEYLQDLTNYWTAVFALEQAVGVELRK